MTANQTRYASYGRNQNTGSMRQADPGITPLYTRSTAARQTAARTAESRSTSARMTGAAARMAESRSTSARSVAARSAGARQTAAASARMTGAAARTEGSRYTGASASYGRRAQESRNEARRPGGRAGAYVSGSVAYQYDVVEEIKKKPVKRLSKQTIRNREKAKLMNLGTVFFMAAAMCVAGVVLYCYLALQTANAASVDEIAAMESQLNALKLENDEEQSRIMSSVNLEEIKTRAIESLGMQYAQEGQVVEVQGASDDYVRQYQDMP